MCACVSGGAYKGAKVTLSSNFALKRGGGGGRNNEGGVTTREYGTCIHTHTPARVIMMHTCIHPPPHPAHTCTHACTSTNAPFHCIYRCPAGVQLSTCSLSVIHHPPTATQPNGRERKRGRQVINDDTQAHIL